MVSHPVYNLNSLGIFEINLSYKMFKKKVIISIFRNVFEQLLHVKTYPFLKQDILLLDRKILPLDAMNR